MSNRPGRNTPCPCGSGKKYKRCCLASDEASARERARQLALFDDEPLGDSDFEVEDDALFDVEGDEASLDKGDAAAGTPTATIPPSTTARSSEVDMTAVLKQHRRQGGTCALCGEAVTRERARNHLAACAPAHDVASGREVELTQIRVTTPGLPAYWLDLEVKGEARLDVLDSFLRGIWVECCGHLSAFNISAVKYLSRGYDFGFARALGSLRQRQISERSMTARVGEALPPTGVRFDYEYDFGSTTRLQLRVVSERAGRPGRAAVRLLARNTAPVWPCAVCGGPATAVCVYCVGDEAGAFACAVHVREHGCGEPEGFLPVANSPRMGVCGYVGEP